MRRKILFSFLFSLWAGDFLLAQAPPKTPFIPSPPPMEHQTLQEAIDKERTRFEHLKKLKRELEEKEGALKAEEQRLLALKKEIEGKIDHLRGQEERLKAGLETLKSFETKAIKDLAKVYETTPPAKAGPMLEKLDTKTAAGITLNMKRDKAGALWAYISPGKAAEITKEITSLSIKYGPRGE